MTPLTQELHQHSKSVVQQQQDGSRIPVSTVNLQGNNRHSFNEGMVPQNGLPPVSEDWQNLTPSGETSESCCVASRPLLGVACSLTNCCVSTQQIDLHCSVPKIVCDGFPLP